MFLQENYLERPEYIQGVPNSLPYPMREARFQSLKTINRSLILGSRVPLTHTTIFIPSLQENRLRTYYLPSRRNPNPVHYQPRSQNEFHFHFANHLPAAHHS